MMTGNDPAEALRTLGFRASAEALRALIAHATKSKMSPAELCLDLSALEKREREQRNLAERTKAATLGSVKPLDRFDWSHPRSIDRELVRGDARDARLHPKRRERPVPRASGLNSTRSR
jgi:hypothetical protein